ncbi:unnamed protein product [Rhizophagus irregularis]|nr:unnamed protein product [Rhizophagus irregularis]
MQEYNKLSSRDTHFKEHGVRWSELLRLPYMDPIRFAVVDPMHCLFLGIAKWIIKSIFINQNKLSMEQLRIAQKRMDYIELPSDIVARFITEDDLREAHTGQNSPNRLEIGCPILG